MSYYKFVFMVYFVVLLFYGIKALKKSQKSSLNEAKDTVNEIVLGRAKPTKQSLQERIMDALNNPPTRAPKRNRSSLEMLKQTVLTKIPKGKLKPLKVNLTIENREIIVPEEYFVEMHCPGAENVPLDHRTMCSAMFEDGGCIPGFEPDVTWELSGEWIQNTIDNWRVVILDDARLLLSPAVVEDSGRFACYIYGDLVGTVVLTVSDYWHWLWNVTRPVLIFMGFIGLLVILAEVAWILKRKHMQLENKVDAFKDFYELKNKAIKNIGTPRNSMYSIYKSQKGMIINRNYYSAMKIVRNRERENAVELAAARLRALAVKPTSKKDQSPGTP